jgi:hypothetical protein
VVVDPSATSTGLAVDHQPVADGDLLEAGRTRLRVLHTPGHTDGSPAPPTVQSTGSPTGSRWRCYPITGT